VPGCSLVQRSPTVCLRVIKKPQYRGGQGSSIGCSAIVFKKNGILIGKHEKAQRTTVSYRYRNLSDTIQTRFNGVYKLHSTDRATYTAKRKHSCLCCVYQHSTVFSADYCESSQ
jgi:hypothetical protein